MKFKKYLVALFVILAAILIATLCCFGFVLYPLKYKDIVEKYSKEFGVKSEMVFAVINVESHFNKDVVSAKGAVGLMQLMPSTAEWIASKLNENYQNGNLFVPEYNIKYGTYYLKYLISKFNNEENAILAYNAGEGTVRGWFANKNNSVDGKFLSNIPYAETKEYLKKVKDNIKVYKIRVNGIS